MADRRTDESSPLPPRRSAGATNEATSGTRTAEHGSGSKHSGSRSGSGTPPRPGGRPGDTTQQRPVSKTASQRPRGARRARLRLTRLDPWSVMKTAFLLSVAFGIVTVIAVAVVWSVLGAAGVWESINNTVSEVLGGDAGSRFDVENYVGTSRVLGFTMVVAVVDVILITAIATLSAFLYNLSAALLGGLEVTLTEDER